MRRHHPQLHAVIALAQLNPAAEIFHPSKAVAGDTSATVTQTNHTTCRVTEESVPRPRRVALQMIPVILEGKNGIKITVNAFLDDGSGSSYLKEVTDILGLDAQRKPRSVAVFGAKSVVTDSKTVTVRL